MTLFIFIKQVLNPDKSCKKAIADFLAEETSAGKEREISTNTGPYCKARQRLPEETVQELVNRSGDLSTKQALSGWKIYGREIKAIDGTTVKMADSEANQDAYPQHKNQEKGAGFPIARLLVVTPGSLSYPSRDWLARQEFQGRRVRYFLCLEKDRPAPPRHNFPP